MNQLPPNISLQRTRTRVRAAELGSLGTLRNVPR
jgi:hypothetical protein